MKICYLKIGILSSVLLTVMPSCSDRSSFSSAPPKPGSPALKPTPAALPETTVNKDSSDVPIAQSTEVPEAPASGLVDETVTQPANITGMYLISCVPTLKSDTEVQVICMITDAAKVRKAPEGELTWGFDHPSKQEVISKVTITPTPADPAGDVLYGIKAASSAELVALMTDIKITVTTLPGVVDGKPYRPCGDAANNCYNDPAALQSGFTLTIAKKPLVTVAMANGEKIWKEFGGNRILRANGTDEWQMSLKFDGSGFGTAPFTDIANIGGRVCPPNVYIDSANMFTIGNCLYYDVGNVAQRLDAGGVLQNSVDSLGLGPWNNYNSAAAKWFVGNIRTCGLKGMRLPALYETRACDSATSYQPAGSPVFAKSAGVPEFGSAMNWTATSSTQDAANYFIFAANNWGSYPYSSSYPLRCVLP